MRHSNFKRGLATILGGLTCALALLGGDLKIHTINVGWGLSVLVEGPTGKHFLLDGGDTGKGTAKVVPYLKAKSIASPLDAIVLSHNHADHAGGLVEVKSAGYVGTKNYYNGSTGGSSTALNWVSSVGATKMLPGDVLDLGGGATATCVAANGTVIGQSTQASQADENDNSIALLLHYGNFYYIWEGDLGGAKDSYDTCSSRSSSQADLEVPMINAISYGGSQALLPATGVDVIQVGHHGSQSSSHPVYIHKTAPQVALISVGQGESGTWALPYTQVVDGVLLSGINGCAGVTAPLVLQTEDGDQNYNSQRSTSGYAVGNIVVRTDGSHFWVSCNSDNADAPYIAAGTLDTEREAAGIPLGTEREFTCKAAGSVSNTVTASITVPAADMTVSSGSIVTFTGAATDSSSTATLSYAWNFGDGATATGLNASHTYSNTGTTASSYTASFTATDNTGASGEATRVITVNPASDTQAPTISVSESGTSGTVTLTATATDNKGVTKVEFYVDGTLAATDTASPYTYALNSTTLANGSHTLVGKAYDAAGNVGTSSSVSFSVSNAVGFTETEPNDTQATANAVGANVTQITGYISSSSDSDDWYSLTLPAGHTLTLNMTGPTASSQVYYLYLYKGSSKVASSTNASTTQKVTYKNSGTSAVTLAIDVKRNTSYSRVTPYVLSVSR